MTKLKEWLIKIGAGIVALGSAIFYVLFKEKKEEKLKEENIKLRQQAEQLHQQAVEIEQRSEEILNAVTENNEVRKANEEALNNCSGNTLSDFNAGLDLLRK